MNHPHICTIYGLEEIDGRPALVMELVEGETLAERLANSRLPLEESQSLAWQLADALAAAHRLGIVHRDLKPANIMLTGSWNLVRVKVLDFGLAKIDPAIQRIQVISEVAFGPPIRLLRPERPMAALVF